MTALSARPEPFGVGKAIGAVFSLFFRRFLPIYLSALVMNLVLLAPELYVVENAVYAARKFLLDELPFNSLKFNVIIFTEAIVTATISLFFNLIALSLTVLVTQNIAASNALRLSRTLASLVGSAPSLIVFAIIGSVVSVLSLVALALPILYVWPLMTVAVVALMLEKAGLGMRRSWQLSNGYRWPVVTVIVTTTAAAILIEIGFNSAIDLTGWRHGDLQANIAFAAAASMTTAIMAVSATLCYRRLREIKEGESPEAVARVFE